MKCVLSAAYLLDTSHNFLPHISRKIGRHYQETKGHPQSLVVSASFVVDYKPYGRFPPENSIKAKIIKQIGGSGLRYGIVSMTNSIGNDASTKNMRIINSSKSLSFSLSQVFTMSPLQ